MGRNFHVVRKRREEEDPVSVGIAPGIRVRLPATPEARHANFLGHENGANTQGTNRGEFAPAPPPALRLRTRSNHDGGKNNTLLPAAPLGKRFMLLLL